MKEVLAYIEKNRETFIEQLKKLLAFPSVSADPAYKEDVVRCAAHVKEKLDELGLKTEIIETPGNPIV